MRTKLRLLVDAQVHPEVADVLMKGGCNVLAAHGRVPSGAPDKTVFQLAAKQRRTLFTQDPDFWDDRRFPIGLGQGIIIVDAGPQETVRTVHAARLWWVILGRFLPGEYYRGLKIRACPTKLVMKFVGSGGAVEEWEYAPREDGEWMQRRRR